MKATNELHENDYFFLRCVIPLGTPKTWLLGRKISTIPGAMPEIINLLTRLEGPSRILVEVGECHLSQALQAVGVNLTGYFYVDAQGPHQVSSGDDITRFSEVGLAEFTQEAPRGEPIYQVFNFNKSSIHHPVDIGSVDFIRFIKARDRYHFDYTLSFFGKTTRNQNDSCVDVHERHSAPFVRKPVRLTSDVLLEILKQTLTPRADGNLPFAMAGGFHNFSIKVSCQGVQGVEDGIYVFTVAQGLVKLNSDPSKEAIYSATYRQDAFCETQVWLALEVELGEMMFKYGPRAYRFSLISAGGFFHHLQVCCASRSIDSRLCGGFDDKLIEDIYGLSSSTSLIPCLVGLGG